MTNAHTSTAGLNAMFSLEGRTALVTGASQGLGFEIARVFASAGARVYLNGRRAEILEAAAGAIRSDGHLAEICSFDVAEAGQCEKAIAGIEAAAGLDILVNNVGVRLRKPSDQISGHDLADHLMPNLVAPYILSRAAARGMAARGWGRIINMSSIGALVGRGDDAAYAAAKGGLTSLTRALATDYGRFGITCNAIAPGPFLTETNVELAQGAAGQPAPTFVQERTSLGRWASASEIGGPALFLASGAASFVTGHTLVVDGGWVSRL